MAYLGFAFILAIAYFIEWLEVKVDDKSTAKVEHTHEKMYALIDEYYDGHEARERKAKVDAMVGALYKDNGKEYRPKNLKQVTTAEERKSRIKSELDGTADDTELLKAQLLDAIECGFECPDAADDWYYEEHSQNERREHLIDSIIAESNVSRQEAEAIADNFISFAEGE